MLCDEPCDETMRRDNASHAGHACSHAHASCEPSPDIHPTMKRNPITQCQPDNARRPYATCHPMRIMLPCEQCDEPCSDQPCADAATQTRWRTTPPTLTNARRPPTITPCHHQCCCPPTAHVKRQRKWNRMLDLFDRGGGSRAIRTRVRQRQIHRNMRAQNF
jgi:hypothetical protein